MFRKWGLREQSNAYQFFPAVSLTCFLSNLFNFLGSFGGAKRPSTSSEVGFQTVLLDAPIWVFIWDPSVAFNEDETGNGGCHVNPTTGFFSGIFLNQSGLHNQIPKIVYNYTYENDNFNQLCYENQFNSHEQRYSLKHWINLNNMPKNIIEQENKLHKSNE